MVAPTRRFSFPFTSVLLAPFFLAGVWALSYGTVRPVRPPYRPAPPEGIRNGGFEAPQLSPWLFRTGRREGDGIGFAPSFQYDGFPREGVRCVRIKNHLRDESWLGQWVRVRPGAAYRLSGWIRTEVVLPGRHWFRRGPGAHLTIEGSPVASAGIRDTQGWTPVEVWFRAGPRQSVIIVSCRLGGRGAGASGKAWFDDVRLDLIYPAPGDLPVALPSGPSSSKRDAAAALAFLMGGMGLITIRSLLGRWRR